MALWSGRFSEDMDEMVKIFNASIDVDRRLYREDILGSVAHVSMLANQGIIKKTESEQIIAGLKEIQDEIESGKIHFSTDDEDIHMAIEKRLIAKIGNVGKKLHTARSRNDQVQTDVKLYTRFKVEEMLTELEKLEQTILEQARANKDVLTVGYTHIQHAQPVTIGFILMAYFQMFKRDMERLMDLRGRMGDCPLGACALAGTTLPIDRFQTAELLGFSAPTENAMDTVSDRDYEIEFVSAAAISMMHISRWAEELAWWNSSEFGFVVIDDSFCTGSSIMPQKKNPDVVELLRGKSARVYGDLMRLLTLMKAMPLAYNKDFQEDKEALFDTVDTWVASVCILNRMLEHLSFNKKNIDKQLKRGFLNATDVAEHLAERGIPFREAHNVVGLMVKEAEAKGCQLEELDDAELAKIDDRLNREMLGEITLEACVRARKSYGGTAPEEVERQIMMGGEWLDGIRKK